MSYYLSRYVCTYRVKSEIDLRTNDFVRNAEGKIETGNTYIKCMHDARIFHYGRDVLECYVPSLLRGRNMLKNIAMELGFDLEKYGTPCSYKQLFEDLENNAVVFDIYESDSECCWKFHAKHIDLIAKYIKPQTSGANISPFSTKNLPKKKYYISLEELAFYRQIIGEVNLDDKLVIAKITTAFITQIIPKNHKEYAKTDMKTLMKQTMLKGKEFIHSLGFWDEYLSYLREQLQKTENLV